MYSGYFFAMMFYIYVQLPSMGYPKFQEHHKWAIYWPYQYIQVVFIDENEIKVKWCMWTWSTSPVRLKRHRSHSSSRLEYHTEGQKGHYNQDQGLWKDMICWTKAQTGYDRDQIIDAGMNIKIKGFEYKGSSRSSEANGYSQQDQGHWTEVRRLTGLYRKQNMSCRMKTPIGHGYSD